MPRRALPFGLKRYGGNTFDKLHACGSGCITASQVPDLFNEGRDGRMALYAHVMGVMDMSPDESELMDRGHDLQPVAAKKYQKETGQTTRNIHARVKHPDLNFYASPDCLTVYDGETEESPGEIKVITYEQYEAFWQKGPPKRVLLQHQAQLTLTGAKKGPIIALIDGEYSYFLKHWTIKAHEGAQRNIIKRVGKALREIAQHKMPPPDLSHLGDQDALIRLSQIHLKDTIDLPEEIEDDWDMYERFGKVESRLKKKRKAAKARVVAALKGHEKGRVGDHLITLKKIPIAAKMHDAYVQTRIGARSIAAIEKRGKKKEGSKLLD